MGNHLTLPRAFILKSKKTLEKKVKCLEMADCEHEEYGIEEEAEKAFPSFITYLKKGYSHVSVKSLKRE